MSHDDKQIVQEVIDRLQYCTQEFKVELQQLIDKHPHKGKVNYSVDTFKIPEKQN